MFIFSTFSFDYQRHAPFPFVYLAYLRGSYFHNFA